MEVNDQNFSDEVLKSDLPVLVDFWAPWCAPCQQLSPMIATLAEKVEGYAKVVKLNLDENPETASKFEVRSIPTVIVFDGGEVVKRLVGIQHPGEYVAALGLEFE